MNTDLHGHGKNGRDHGKSERTENGRTPRDRFFGFSGFRDLLFWNRVMRIPRLPSVFIGVPPWLLLSSSVLIILVAATTGLGLSADRNPYSEKIPPWREKVFHVKRWMTQWWHPLWVFGLRFWVLDARY